MGGRIIGLVSVRRSSAGLTMTVRVSDMATGPSLRASTTTNNPSRLHVNVIFNLHETSSYNNRTVTRHIYSDNCSDLVFNLVISTIDQLIGSATRRIAAAPMSVQLSLAIITLYYRLSGNKVPHRNPVRRDPVPAVLS